MMKNNLSKDEARKLSKLEALVENINEILDKPVENMLVFIAKKKQFQPFFNFLYEPNELNDYGKVIYRYAKPNNWFYLNVIREDNWNETEALGKYTVEDVKRDCLKRFLNTCREGTNNDGRSSILESSSPFSTISANIFESTNISVSANYCKYEALFWALMILAVDKNNESEKISAICDLISLINMSDDEVRDILHIVKLIFRDADKNYQFKTKTVPEELNPLIKYYRDGGND